MVDLRRLMFAASLLTLGMSARAQYEDQTPTNDVPGMVVAPTALPPLGLRTPDALILARPDVQADLRLTAVQRRQFARLGSAVSDRQSTLDEAADVTNQNVFSPLPMEAINSYVDNQVRADVEAESGIAAILTRPQRARFAQIRLQLDGPMAFLRAELLEQLMADDDQADAIRRIVSAAREKIVQNPQFPLTNRDVPRRDGRRSAVETETQQTLEERLVEARVANERVRDDAIAQISRILRKQQWDAYIKLRGTPFVQASTAPRRQAPAPPRSTPGVRRPARPAPESEPD